MATYKRKHQKGTSRRAANSKIMARKDMAKIGKKVSTPMRRRRAGKRPHINSEVALTETREIIEESI